MIQYEDQHVEEDPDLEKLMPHLRRKRIEKQKEERKVKQTALEMTEYVFIQYFYFWYQFRQRNNEIRSRISIFVTCFKFEKVNMLC